MNYSFEDEDIATSDDVIANDYIDYWMATAWE